MSTHAPDIELALRHVEFGKGNLDTPVNIRLLDDRKEGRSARKLFGTVRELWPQILAAQAEGYGAFFVVNEGGDTDAEITSICAVFVDADGIPLPEQWHVPPDFIVQRDETHWHAYWRTLDLPVNRFREIQRRLAAHYGTDPAVCNPSRVMRLAGTLHQKVIKL